MDLQVIKGRKNSKRVSAMDCIKKQDLQDILDEFEVRYSKSLKKSELLQLVYDTYNSDENGLLLYILSYPSLKLLKDVVNGKDTIRFHMFDYEKIEAITDLTTIGIVDCELKPDEKRELGIKCDISINKNIEKAIMRLVSDESQLKSKEMYNVQCLILGISRAYGLIEIDVMYEMICNLLNKKVDEGMVIKLIMHNITLLHTVTLAQVNGVEYICLDNVDNIEYILDERERRNLTYKPYTIKQLEVLAGREVYTKKEQEFLEIILDIDEDALGLYAYGKLLIMQGIEAADVLDLYMEELEIDEIEEFDDEDIEEFINLFNDIYNDTAQFGLYGYSPKELIQKMKKQEFTYKEKEIGRNDLCPCGSGKKHKKCCYNKQMTSDFLSMEEQEEFYYLWLRLLDYTNKKYKVNKYKIDFNKTNLNDAKEFYEISQALWEKDEIIDEFILENIYNFNKQQLEILKQWKEKRITGKFTLYKYEDDYTILMDDNYLYKIKGICHSISRNIPIHKLPLFIETTLLPFKGKVIYDGIINTYDIKLVGRILEFSKENEKKLIKQGKIIDKL